MFQPSDISFVLSGGSDNRDHNLSLGGEPSVQPIVGTIDNLFDNISINLIGVGGVDYRCFYVFNDSPDTVLHDASIYVSSEIAGGTGVVLGFVRRDDVQVVTLSGSPQGGGVTFGYENKQIVVNYAGLSPFAESLASLLETLPGTGIVSYTILGQHQFSLSFSGAKFQPLLIVAVNSTGVDVAVSKTSNGSPVNSITTRVMSGTTVPNGITFGYPVESEPYALGDLYPGDGFPVWVRRTLDPNAKSVPIDGFTIRIGGSPSAITSVAMPTPVPIPPPPVPIPLKPPTPSLDQYETVGGISVSGSAILIFGSRSDSGSGGVSVSGTATVTSSVPPAPPQPCQICCTSGTLPDVYIAVFSHVLSHDTTICSCMDFDQGSFPMSFDEITCVWRTPQIALGGNTQKTSLLLYYDQGDHIWRLTGGTLGCGGLSASWKASAWNCCGPNTQSTSVSGVVPLDGCTQDQSNQIAVTVLPGCKFPAGSGFNYFPYDPNGDFGVCDSMPPCNNTAGDSCPEVVGGGVLVSGYAEYGGNVCLKCSDLQPPFPPPDQPQWHTVKWTGFGGFPAINPSDPAYGINATAPSLFPIFFGIFRGGQQAGALCTGSFDVKPGGPGQTAVEGIDFLFNPSQSGAPEHYVFGCGTSSWNTGVILIGGRSGTIVLEFDKPDGVVLADHRYYTINF